MKPALLLLLLPVLVACGTEPPANTPHHGHAAAATHNHAPEAQAGSKGHPADTDFSWEALKPPRPSVITDLGNTRDPHTRKPIDQGTAVTAEYKGFRIHFESENTRQRFFKQPIRYLAELALEPRTDGSVVRVDSSKHVDRAPDLCPMMPDSSIDPHGTVFLLHRGYKFYFCCWTGCGDAFMQDPAKYYAYYGLAERDGALVLK